MRFIILIIILVFIAGQPCLAKRIVPHSDLTYLGAFKMPSSVEDNKCFQWTGVQGGIEYYSKGDLEGPVDGYEGSLFVSGKIGCPTIGEISIPKPIIGSLDLLNVATVISPMTNIGNGDLSCTGTESLVNTGVGQVVVVPSSEGDKLFVVMHKGYNTGDRVEEFASVNIDFSLSLGFNGWYTLNGVHTSEAGHYVFKVPQEWANENTNGKTVIIGGNRHSGQGSHGATMYAVQPWLSNESPLSSGSSILSQQIISYGSTYQMDNYGMSNSPSDFEWVEVGSTQAIISNHLHVARMRFAMEITDADWTTHQNGWYYAGPHPEGTGGKGFHNEPYTVAIGLYDPDDLADSLSGVIEPYEVQPYAFYNIGKYAYDNPYHVGIEPKNSSGIDFDDNNKILYFVERPSNATKRIAVVHVFKVNEGGGTLDVSSPSQPKNLKINKVTDAAISLSWDASIEMETDVSYLLYLNGYPVIRTTNTYYDYGSVGKFVEKWRAGAGYPSINSFSFKITAVDDYFNESGFSNTVIHDYTSSLIQFDVNQDSTINTVDAMLTLRNSLGLDMSLTNWHVLDATGDVNCDGSLNAIDAVLLLRYSLGLDMGETDWCE